MACITGTCSSDKRHWWYRNRKSWFERFIKAWYTAVSDWDYTSVREEKICLKRSISSESRYASSISEKICFICSWNLAVKLKTCVEFLKLIRENGVFGHERGELSIETQVLTADFAWEASLQAQSAVKEDEMSKMVMVLMRTKRLLEAMTQSYAVLRTELVSEVADMGQRKTWSQSLAGWCVPATLDCCYD